MHIDSAISSSVKELFAKENYRSALYNICF